MRLIWAEMPVVLKTDPHQNLEENPLPLAVSLQCPRSTKLNIMPGGK